MASCLTENVSNWRSSFLPLKRSTAANLCWGPALDGSYCKLFILLLIEPWALHQELPCCTHLDTKQWRPGVVCLRSKSQGRADVGVWIPETQCLQNAAFQTLSFHHLTRLDHWVSQKLPGPSIYLCSGFSLFKATFKKIKTLPELGNQNK